MKEHGIFRSTVAVSAFTGASRLLGFVREVLMAVFFGTSLAKSAFDVAFTIPNLFRRLFGEGALSAAFVPVMTRTLATEGKEEANRFMNGVMTMLAVTLASLVLAGVAIITLLIGSRIGFGPKAAAVLPLLRIMLPYMFFICLVALCMSILNSFHHFAVPAATPVVLNLVWISVLVFICPLLGDSPGERIYGVAVGVLAAGVLQLAIQVPVLLRYGVGFRISFAWRDPHIRRVLTLMGPAALGMGVHQLNVCIDKLLALWAASWAPAALTFSERLVYLPLGLFATALGTVLLPAFSRHAAVQDYGRIRSTLSTAASNLMLIMIPSAVGLGVMALPLVRLVFLWQGGEFDAQSAIQTARALRFYAPGLVVFSLYKMLVPAFYALHDTRTPVKVGLWAVGLNFLLNVLFVVTWPAGYKHAGLAFATVISSTVNGVVLARILKRRLGKIGWPAVTAVCMKALAASAVMAAVVLWLHGRLCRFAAESGWEGKLAELSTVCVSVIAAVLVYAGLTALLCPQQTRKIWSQVTSGLRK